MVELAEGAARVGEHVRHVVVHGLHVREQLAVVEVARRSRRPRDVTVERGRLEPDATSVAGARRARDRARHEPARPSGPRAARMAPAAAPSRSRTGSQPARLSHRQVAMAGAASIAIIPPRHQPTTWTCSPPQSSETPLWPLGSLVHPVLEAQVAVVERDRAVIHQVGRIAAGDQCSASEQPLRRSKQLAGAASGGRAARAHGGRSRTVWARGSRHRALRALVDDRRRVRSGPRRPLRPSGPRRSRRSPAGCRPRAACHRKG